MLSKNRKILLVLIILLVPWTLSQAVLREITLPAERLALDGISLLPINEKGWEILVHQPHMLKLGRPGNKPPEENYIISTEIFWPIAKFASQEEFLDFAKKRFGIGISADSLRAKNRKTDIQPIVIKDNYCAHIHIKDEDHGVPFQLHKGGYMIIENYSLICSHPIKKNIGISVSYSQRYYPDGRDPELLKKANEVLTNVRFTPIRELPTEEASFAAGAIKMTFDRLKEESNFCKKKYPQFTATIDQGIKTWNKEDKKIISAAEYFIGETFKKYPEERKKYEEDLKRYTNILNNKSEEESLQICQQDVSGLEAERWKEWKIELVHLYFVLENIYSVLELDTKGKTH